MRTSRAAPREQSPPMGRVQNTVNGDRKSTTAGRWPARLCLCKNCGNRFQPIRWNQRYCQQPHCLREVRRWQATKRQRRRRQSPQQRQQHAQAERQRRKQKKQQAIPKSTTPNQPTSGPDRAWSRSKNSDQDFCDRPGCYDPRRSSSRAAARYCSDNCRQALRRVTDRERKWLRRNTSAGRFKRRIEYQRRAENTPGHPGQNSENTAPAGGGGSIDAIVGRRLFAVF